MTKLVVFPIVGMHFRPPATQVLARMAVGTELTLVIEPGNAYDPFAVQVWGDPASVPEELHAELAEAILGGGFDLGEVLAGGAIQLGYIGASDGKVCKKYAWVGNKELPKRVAQGALMGRLGLMSNGSAGVELSVEDGEELYGAPQGGATL